MFQSKFRAAWPLLVVAAFAAISLHPDPTRAQAQDGKALYEGKCGGCHSLDANRIGPMHRGVVGRKIASVPGFDYSPAIKKLGGAWTPALLDKWLMDPQAVAPGSKMFTRVADTAQRQAIVGYLVSVSPPAPPAAKPKAKPKAGH
jgi:cytochrome c